jgi:hypothetical protein
VTTAKILLKLWKLRLWVAIGAVVALVAAVGSLKTTHSKVYAAASTQMLVDAPSSAIANSNLDLTGFAARASVYARLMTTDEAMQYIGQAAGIPGNLIDANGPLEVNGSPTSTHAPVQTIGGKDAPYPAIYKLAFVQNPDLPTIDVYAQAPTTAQAIALANGAVTGFSKFVDHFQAATVPAANRVEVRSLGGATGGIVDAAASKKIAVLAFLGVLAAWCVLLLWVSRVRADLRAAKEASGDDLEHADDLRPGPEPERVPLAPEPERLSPAAERKLSWADAPAAARANPLKLALREARTARAEDAEWQPGADQRDQPSSGAGENHTSDGAEDALRREVGLRR